MSSIRIAKRELRQVMRRITSEISADSITRQTQNVTNLLFSMPEYQAARRVGIYLSMMVGEIATAPIVRHALENGKQVFVPYTYKPAQIPTTSSGHPSSVMDMVLLHSWEDYVGLEVNHWGIPTPSEASIPMRQGYFGEVWKGGGSTVEKTSPGDEELDLILVPGMAFDVERRRLGHGKGFYDFFFHRYREDRILKDGEKAKMPLLVGLALEEQMLPEPQSIPTDDRDWQLDSLLVGDGRIFRATKVQDPVPETPTFEYNGAHPDKGTMADHV
ncbi:MAG: hypothetical protein M1816_000101 [Peltula sp. TS41687]|nr:MAG: hypothetical protein M1816_000101 [Peltula sp. TS41687]